MSRDAVVSLAVLPDLTAAGDRLGIDRLWLRYDPALTGEVAGLAARAGVPCPAVLVVPWLGHRCLDQSIGSYGLAELHQAPGQQPVMYVAEAVLTDLTGPGRRQVLAHEVAHLKLHRPVRHAAALDRAITAAAYLPLVSWMIYSHLAQFELPLKFLVAMVLLFCADRVHYVRDLVGELEADRYGVELAPVDVDQVNQLWDYLDRHLGTTLTDRYRRRRQLAAARKTWSDAR